MSKKLFVGNLPFNVTDDSLKASFAKFGDVSEAIVIKNKFDNRSKGFGFVTFAVDADAEKAIAEMNGKDFEGRNLTVNVATPMDPNAPRKPRFGDRNGGGFGNSGGGRFGGNRSSGGFGNRPFKKRFDDKKKESGDDDFAEEGDDDNQSFGSDI